MQTENVHFLDCGFCIISALIPQHSAFNSGYIRTRLSNSDHRKCIPTSRSGANPLDLRTSKN